MAIPFSFKVLACQDYDIYDDNIDVVIEVTGKGRYWATFFTLKNLASLFEKNKKTGECANGTYFCADNMILVENLKTDTIYRTIEGLLENEEIDLACANITNSDSEES